MNEALIYLGGFMSGAGFGVLLMLAIIHVLDKVETRRRKATRDWTRKRVQEVQDENRARRKADRLGE